MKKIKFDLRFLYLFIPMLLLELIFHLVQFKSLEFFTVLRIFLFVSFLSFFISLITTRFSSRKVYFIVGLIVMIWFCAYSFVELIFKNFMGDFYSFGTVGDGALRIAQYAVIFLTAAKLPYYFCFLPLIVYILLHKYVHFNDKGPFQLPAIFCILSFLLLIPTMDLGSGVNSILKTYDTFSNKTVIIDKYGIEHFFFRDLSALAYKAPDTIEIIEEEPVEEQTPVNQSVKREISDGEWKNIAKEEVNANMQTIDKYLMNRQITQTNEKTGIFEDYNFIYFMVEAMDYLAIDKDLTPTLYKMYSEGIHFSNHYTPLYSCATGESELVSYLSIFPYVNVCTPNYIAGISYYEALPYMFKNKGYSTFALHNWRDEFYERRSILPAIGFDNYYDIDDIWKDTSIPHTNGWQSDKMLIEQAIKHMDETNGKFFCDIITSVMHFPYDESSYWGDYYIDQINEVHPEWTIEFKRYMSKCMDFDAGLKVLLEYLESSGKADNTVICIYPDHRPYWMDYDQVMEATRHIDPLRFGENGIYRSPLIIYNRTIEPEINENYCSTLDHAPTIANLFNLNYDPRLFMGTDAFNGDNIIILANGNWICRDGYYDATTEKFIPNDPSAAVSDAFVSRTNANVQNTIKISYLIMDEDYFSKRRSICSPR
ncbi:MAG: LTA synthase family protein [Erysipelotrichaceae bacterium]|nr:LTA synthase family protein [Erysipelotrichaceae bacterium]